MAKKKKANKNHSCVKCNDMNKNNDSCHECSMNENNLNKSNQ